MKYQRPHKLKYGKWGLIFILPFFIAYGIFNLYPLIMTFYNSFFSKYEDLFDTVVQFVGFDNYVKVFTEGQILKYFGNTFLLWLLGFIPQILISLLFASWFTDLRLKLKGTGAVKVILYLPNMLMASSVAVLFATLFAVTGPVNQLFGTAFNFLKLLSCTGSINGRCFIQCRVNSHDTCHQKNCRISCPHNKVILYLI